MYQQHLDNSAHRGATQQMSQIKPIWKPKRIDGKVKGRKKWEVKYAAWL